MVNLLMDILNSNEVSKLWDKVPSFKRKVFIYPLHTEYKSHIEFDNEGIQAELIFPVNVLRLKDIVAFLCYLSNLKGFISERKLNECIKALEHFKFKPSRYFYFPFERKEKLIGLISSAYFRQSDYIKIRFTLALINPEESFKGKKVFKSKWLLPQQVTYAYFCAICDLFNFEKPQLKEDVIFYSPKDLYEIFYENFEENKGKDFKEKISLLQSNGLFSEDYLFKAS